MQPPHQHSRINLAELKAQIVRKLGPERSKQYFSYLNRLLSLKLSKVEFNKLCLRIVGRDNIPLHNQFIRSILKNAFASKLPPPTQNLESLKQKATVENNDPTIGGSLQNGSHPNPMALTNGDILPLSPRKARTGVRERRAGDRRSSALGPNGKTSFASSQLLSVTTSSPDYNIITENGESTPRNSNFRAVQHHQGLIQQQQQQEENRSSSDGFALPVHSKDQHDKLLVRQEEVSARNLVRAPLGIPFCQPSIGGSRRPPLTLPGGSHPIGSFNFGGLLDSVTLRERMEQIAASQGLEGVSIECANVLNNGLDAYLKRLISSSFELVGARSALNSTNNYNQKQQQQQQSHFKLNNGFRQRGHDFQVQSSSSGSRSLEVPHCANVSLLDFRVAMELNPRQLGDDWPFLLEKICTHSFEE